MFEFILGFAAGGVACALSVTVYNFFKSKTAQAESAVVGAVANTAANAIISKL